MHVTQFVFDAADRGEISPELALEILKEHLAAICPVCAEAIAAHEAGRGPARGRGPAAARDPVERVGRRLGLGERQLRAEEKVARGWVREIVQLDPAQRCGRVYGAYSRFRGPLFGALLLEEARRAIPAHPGESLSLAEAALVSCQRTTPHQPDPEVQAAALAVRGNAQRALARFREAEEDLREARRLLDAPGLSDPALPAEVDNYLGSLRKDQGRLDEAARHLRRAGTLYGLLGDLEMSARVFLLLGNVHFRAHELDAAVGATEEALALLAPDSEAWLTTYAHYNLAHHLHAAGDIDRAEAELAAHGELLAAAGERVLHHVGWLRARIAWSRGDLRAAEGLYAAARARALERGIAFDTSQVSLELALVYLAQGRTGRVKKLAIEALEVFAEHEIEREIRAALALVEAAARREALTREIVEAAIASLEGARHARPSPGREPS
jgi:tetratricopeptide (TPR) repeat protein